MTPPLPGWIPYAEAGATMRRAGLQHRTWWRLLKRVPKHRRQPVPGKGRRKYWYIKQEDFDRLMVEARAAAVEGALGPAAPDWWSGFHDARIDK